MSITLLSLIVIIGCALLGFILFIQRQHDKQKDLLIRQDTKLENLLQSLRLLTSEQTESRQVQIHALHKLEIILQQKLSEVKLEQQHLFNSFKEQIQKELYAQREQFDKRQIEGLQALQAGVQKYMQDVRLQLTSTLTHNADILGQHFAKLTAEINTRLNTISGQVEKRLTEGFEKTTATFTDIVKRLALIDEAQKKITELSTNVVSLQEVLADKRSRGAFGEVQLTALIRNLMPESSYGFQHQLSNDKRADCILFLPQPTGNIIIDAKFPLESYQKMTDIKQSDSDRHGAEQQFRQDIRKHINDIAGKYIIPGETSDGAVMFIPAEAVFAEIHGHYPELVEESHKQRVWMTSPTTMMAILTTARAVLKDADTRKQVHVIQEHLGFLSKDFERFQQRMDNLARHIQQAHEDVKEAHVSARKITSRFNKIENVELEQEESAALPVLETSEDPAL